MAQPTTPTVETVAPGAPRTRAYSDADMDSAWRKCIEAYASEPVVKSTMGASAPERSTGDRFTLKVNGTFQAAIMEKELPGLQKMLRDTLENDSVTLSIEISQEELPSSMWTDDQVMHSILERHPKVSEFIAKYKLRLM